MPTDVAAADLEPISGDLGAGSRDPQPRAQSDRSVERRTARLVRDPAMRSVVVEHLRPAARSSSAWSVRSARAGVATVQALWRGAAEAVADPERADPALGSPSVFGDAARTVATTPDAARPDDEASGAAALVWIIVFAALLNLLFLWSSVEERRRRATSTAAAVDAPGPGARDPWEEVVDLIDARRAAGWQLPESGRSPGRAARGHRWAPDPHVRWGTPPGSAGARGAGSTTAAPGVGTMVAGPPDVELSSRVVIWTAPEPGR